LNRHAFYSLMASGGKPGDVEWGSAVVIDIDNLKPINDSIGHSAGDEVIRVVATAIRSAIRPDDLLFRWGGDEFLALMFGFKDTDVRARIETLNERLNSRPDQHGGGAPAVSISFGIASFGAVSEIEHAIDRADIQMYQTKQSRKQSGRLSQTMTRGGD
ncbi:MAG TPA: GGDEF domain-containing protein, partial [Blastocatellia bacterium]|nr:GGDEF domain-containing protein [Blastocatellia bacterium]